ncbi:MAG: TonB C-terminal domain-containing protein, partial [Sphingomonadaceae bacterium]
PFADGDVTPIEYVEIGPVTTSTSPSAPAERAPPTPLPPEPDPEPAEAAAPEPMPVEPAPSPAPAAPAPEPRDLAVQDAAPRERPRPTPPPPTFDAGALEQLIDRNLKRTPQRAAPGTDAAARGTSPGRLDSRAMATLEAAIRSQIAPCWNPPVGGQDVRNMTAVLRIRLNRDGSVAAPPELVSQTGATDANAAYARAFVETARRAVLRCAPLDLPAELYAQWREFELNFDPRMLT